MSRKAILTEEESKELQDLAMSAAGADPARGDVVKVTSMQFSSFDEEKIAAQNMMKSIETTENVGFLISKLGPMIIVLIFGLTILFMLKGVLKKTYEGRIISGAEGSGQDEYALQESELEKLAQESQKLVEGSNLPMLEASLAPELEMMKSQLNNMILSNPSDASRLLLSFIKD